MAARKQAIKPDDKGRYRPRIGWVVEHDARVQPRFNLGSERREAEVRYARLLKLYDDDCKAHGQHEWTLRGLEYARRVAAGATAIEYSPNRGDDNYDPTVVLPEYASKVNLDRDRFPSLDLRPSDPLAYSASAARADGYVAERVRELEAELRQMHALIGKDGLPATLEAGTFHEALDAYAETIRRDCQKLDGGVLKPYPRLRLARVERFKREHQDRPLARLTHDGCSALIAHWRNRPATRRSTRSSRDSARHHVHELLQFCRWLDATDLYRWELPRGLLAVSRKIDRLEAEKKLTAITKTVYTPEQLAVLNRHATPLERAALLCGLNFAMGAAELGRLVAGDFAIRQPHPLAAQLRCETTPNDTFLRRLRPKTEVFGEWLAWPETVVMVEWLIGRAATAGTDVLFVREGSGQPLYNEAATNAQAGFANIWTRLLDRVQKSDPAFPRLPFGSLRDTLPEVLRQDYSDELASMAIAHGKPARGDSLLECYSNKPFGRFHAAVRKLRRHFEPMFAAVADPLAEGKQYLPLATRDRVRAMLAAGHGPTDVARACGVSRMTVLRERKAVPAGETAGGQGV